MALESFMAEELALATTAAFTGAAICVSVAEQPARLGIDEKALLAEWKFSYLLGAALIFGNWPYTLLVILPVNKHIAATSPDAASADTRDLIRRWGSLHVGGSALGLAATLPYLWAST